MCSTRSGQRQKSMTENVKWRRVPAFHAYDGLAPDTMKTGCLQAARLSRGKPRCKRPPVSRDAGVSTGSAIDATQVLNLLRHCASVHDQKDAVAMALANALTERDALQLKATSLSLDKNASDERVALLSRLLLEAESRIAALELVQKTDTLGFAGLDHSGAITGTGGQGGRPPPLTSPGEPSRLSEQEDPNTLVNSREEVPVLQRLLNESKLHSIAPSFASPPSSSTGSESSLPQQNARASSRSHAVSPGAASFKSGGLYSDKWSRGYIPDTITSSRPTRFQSGERPFVPIPLPSSSDLRRDRQPFIESAFFEAQTHALSSFTPPNRSDQRTPETTSVNSPKPLTFDANIQTEYTTETPVIETGTPMKSTSRRTRDMDTNTSFQAFNPTIRVAASNRVNASTSFEQFPSTNSLDTSSFINHQGLPKEKSSSISANTATATKPFAKPLKSVLKKLSSLPVPSRMEPKSHSSPAIPTKPESNTSILSGLEGFSLSSASLSSVRKLLPADRSVLFSNDTSMCRSLREVVREVDAMVVVADLEREVVREVEEVRRRLKEEEEHRIKREDMRVKKRVKMRGAKEEVEEDMESVIALMNGRSL
ncbi:hypothetical protein BC830DRAFT_1142371 [Chytriomyces sp. MP71]|nr:hypothetical protein BC830DRAFT_1142371 [Chytriomyces sp. MP71]